MTGPGMANLEDFIVTVEGLLSSGECQALIDTFDARVKRAVVEGGEVHESRTCSQIRLEGVNDTLDSAAVSAVQTYRRQHPNARVTGIVPYVFLKYELGQFYKQHVDSFPDKPRLLTISIALNDDFEGGEWAWFDRKIVKRFKTGDAVLFPSNFMFPHEILPVTKGTRYALITWFT
jgi:predicted 2-oxoglutarate/Fe(II)-dependent dioxygenase YbiX